MKHLLLIIGCFFIVLTQNAQTELWGMTEYGGQNGGGVIYKTDGSGNNHTTEYEFTQTEGGHPQLGHLIQANDGMFYGMTSIGGKYDSGVIFQYDPVNDIYTKKRDFGSYISGVQGSLVQASDGNLYGINLTGGANFCGVLFQYNIVTNIYTAKYSFSVGVNGNSPYGSLIQANDGMLYGMTYQGGSSNVGVLFQYNPLTDVYTKKINFIGTATGTKPYGSLYQALDGNLYGMTFQGGVNNLGVLFQYDPVANILTKKIDFDGTNKGSKPKGSLMQGMDGNLYGVTSSGGVNNSGVLFQYDPVTVTYNKKVDFDSLIIGNKAYGSLTQTSDGKFYGVTSTGGINNMGTLFQYDLSLNTCIKKIDFSGVSSGSNPQGSLMLATDGSLYGMTSNSGSYARGVLFKYDPSINAFTKKLDFGSATGINPQAKLVQATDGNLYGTTTAGGIQDMGVLFQYNPITHSYLKLLDFTGVVNGRTPYGGLMTASNGKLYGTTLYGGSANSGVLFQYDISTSSYTKLFDFTGTATGSNPSGTPLQATDGNLYGLTGNGGTTLSSGVLYQYDPVANIYTKKFDFNMTAGRTPSGSLMQASDGKLYSSTASGGTHNKGVIFQYDIITDTYLKKYDLLGGTMGEGLRSMVQASDGNLYGMTTNGGTIAGVIYQFNPVTNVYTKKVDFNGPNGIQPFADLMVASDGNLYGMTNSGGSTGDGVMLQYDPINDVCTTKIDFNYLNGSVPMINNIIEINATITKAKENSNNNNLSLYPNPNNGSFTIELISKSQIIITNVLGEVVLNKLLETGKQELSVQLQVNGVYFVKVTDAKGESAIKKILKQ